MNNTHMAFKGVTLNVVQNGLRQEIISNVNFNFPRETMALISETRLNVRSVIDLICGSVFPQKGTVKVKGRVSWPIGDVSLFYPQMNGKETLYYFSNLYNFKFAIGYAFIQQHLPDPDVLKYPISSWQHNDKLQFMLLMALLPEFSVYIIDSNIVFPKNYNFTEKFLNLLRQRTKNKTTLITVRQEKVIRAWCKCAVIVSDNGVHIQTNIEDALKLHKNDHQIDLHEIQTASESDDESFMF